METIVEHLPRDLDADLSARVTPADAAQRLRDLARSMPGFAFPDSTARSFVHDQPETLGWSDDIVHGTAMAAFFLDWTDALVRGPASDRSLLVAAAACLQRQLDVYASITRAKSLSGADTVRTAMDLVWAHAGGQRVVFPDVDDREVGLVPVKASEDRGSGSAGEVLETVCDSFAYYVWAARGEEPRENAERVLDRAFEVLISFVETTHGGRSWEQVISEPEMIGSFTREGHRQANDVARFEISLVETAARRSQGYREADRGVASTLREIRHRAETSPLLPAPWPFDIDN